MARVASAWEAALKADNLYDALVDMTDLSIVKVFQVVAALRKLGAITSAGLHPALGGSLDETGEDL